MESSRSKPQTIMPPYVSPPRSDLPATFESLNDDTKRLILKFVGNKSYVAYGGINKHCRDVYLNTPGMTKETFLFGYGPLSVIQDRYDSDPSFEAQVALSKGVVFYNRRDVLYWALEEENLGTLKEICSEAAREGRIDTLDEVWNNMNDGDDKEYIYGGVDLSAARRYVFSFVTSCAARYGKPNVLKWLEDKGKDIRKEECAKVAANGGQLHVIQWLKDEQGLELDGELYNCAAWGCQLRVLKWLREQKVPWGERTFVKAAEKGSLDILQWLHDEGCPWDRRYRVPERILKSEVIEWLRMNGYGSRVDNTNNDP